MRHSILSLMRVLAISFAIMALPATSFAANSTTSGPAPANTVQKAQPVRHDPRVANRHNRQMMMGNDMNRHMAGHGHYYNDLARPQGHQS